MSQPPPIQPNPGVYPSGPPPPGMTPSQQQRMMPPQYQQMGMQQQFGLQQQMIPGYAPMMPMMPIMNTGMQQQPGLQHPMVAGYAPMKPMPMMNPGVPMMNPVRIPPPPPGPPPPMDLSVLKNISHVFIKQRVDMTEVMTGWDTNNRYDIVTPDGGYLFYCQEMSDDWSRQVWGAGRALTIGIMDLYGRQVIQLFREAYSSFTSPSLQVMSPPGKLIGNVIPDGWNLTSFTVSVGGENLILQGPNTNPCCMLCGFDLQTANDFVLRTGDRSQEIGKISKLWSGYFQEVYTNADNFGISFPVNLSLEMKAVLIGAAILIDFQFYDLQPHERRRRESDRRRRSRNLR